MPGMAGGVQGRTIPPIPRWLQRNNNQSKTYRDHGTDQRTAKRLQTLPENTISQM